MARTRTRLDVCAALLITTGVCTAPVAAQQPQLTQTDWRFYSDAAPDGAMTPLAARAM
jgi:hypothetical protein